MADWENRQDGRESPCYIEFDKHIVAEWLHNTKAHLGRRGSSTDVVDYSGWDGGFILGTAFEYRKDAPKAIGEQERHHVRHTVSALASGSQERNNSNDDKRIVLLDKKWCSRQDWRKVEKLTEIAHETNNVDFVLRTVCLDVQGAVSRALRGEKLQVGVRVLMMAHDQLSEMSQEALCIIIVNL